MFNHLGGVCVCALKPRHRKINHAAVGKSLTTQQYFKYLTRTLSMSAAITDTDLSGVPTSTLYQFTRNRHQTKIVYRIDAAQEKRNTELQRVPPDFSAMCND